MKTPKVTYTYTICTNTPQVAYIYTICTNKSTTSNLYLHNIFKTVIYTTSRIIIKNKLHLKKMYKDN